jgi:hypothetical protein
MAALGKTLSRVASQVSVSSDHKRISVVRNSNAVTTFGK